MKSHAMSFVCSGVPSEDLKARLHTLSDVLNYCSAWLQNVDYIFEKGLYHYPLPFYLRGREAEVTATNVALLIGDILEMATEQNVHLHTNKIEAVFLQVATYSTSRYQHPTVSGETP